MKRSLVDHILRATAYGLSFACSAAAAYAFNAGLYDFTLDHWFGDCLRSFLAYLLISAALLLALLKECKAIKVQFGLLEPGECRNFLSRLGRCLFLIVATGCALPLFFQQFEAFTGIVLQCVTVSGLIAAWVSFACTLKRGRA